MVKFVEVPDAWRTSLGYVTDNERRRSRKRPEKPKKPKKPPPSRLPADDVADLEFYWNQFDAVIGLRSSWFEQAEAMDECGECGFRFEAKSRKTLCPSCKHMRGQPHQGSLIRVKSGQGSAWHPSYDTEIVGVVTGREMERAGRIRDVLVAMTDKGYSYQVMVLYRAYGDLNRFAPFGRFGDLAQIVTLTNIAHQLSKKFGLPEREAIDQRLRQVGADLVIERIRGEALKLLIDAGAKYTARK